MLRNELYTNRRLNQAMVKGGKIYTQEQKGWFYKAWSLKKATKDTPDMRTPVNDKEYNVFKEMDKLRETYRFRHEQIRRVFPPARPFNEQRKTIEESVLFDVFRAMPKGSLLHVHGGAALSAEGLMQLIEHWDGIEMYVIFQDKSILVNTPRGQVLKNYLEGQLVYETQGLQAHEFESAKSFLQDSENERWLLERISMCSPSRTAAIPYIWDEFNLIFLRTAQLFESREFYYRYHKMALEEMKKDRIDYVELRCGFQDFRKDREPNESAVVKMTADDYEAQRNQHGTVTARLEGIYGQSHEFLHLLYRMNEEEKRQIRNDGITMRVILCARRDLEGILDEEAASTEKLKRKTDYAILLGKIAPFQDFLLGFDYVSEEDRGKTTYSYYHKLIYGKFGQNYPHGDDAVAMLCQITGLEPEPPEIFSLEGDLGDSDFLRIRLIDFYLHDGESVWSDNDNVMDAAICTKYRIGHGFNMNRFRTLIQGVEGGKPGPSPEVPGTKYPEDLTIPVGDAKGLILEICPISNQMLRYFPDLRSHMAYDLMKQGIQCVLGNDDPQILGNPGLSYDFWEAYVGMGLGMQAIKGLIFNSFAWKQMADAYPRKEEATAEDYDQWIRAFNRDLWEPFIQRAADIFGI